MMFQAAPHAATLTLAITTLNRANTIAMAAVATGMETAGAAKLELFVGF
jgi:hypothetical protein